ncbi:hypothetical protein HMPREF0663_11369 [Hoylesella oralis ATCC 33269]|uniref:Uncharacterized protein n=1 Tax=Hoylesella oralis ATCC 33269 TaxID=873533 RepID=E7RQB8_9BACT|nr:hypothetical protein HMPREF0663_11369 [Hoylesella oralis ATCC 33269]
MFLIIYLLYFMQIGMMPQSAGAKLQLIYQYAKTSTVFFH